MQDNNITITYTVEDLGFGERLVTRNDLPLHRPSPFNYKDIPFFAVSKQCARRYL
jgi:hypothetical protein